MRHPSLPLASAQRFARFSLRWLPVFLLAWTASAAEPIKLGVFSSLTGKEATWGQSSEKATRLAVDDLNAKGGVLGRPLSIVVEDNQSKPGESATSVRKLISRDKVVAVLGDVSSGRSLEAAPVCQQAKIPMISSGSNVKVTQVGNYIFRAHFIDSFQGTVMAKFAREKLKLSRVGLLVDVGNAYSTDLAKYFVTQFQATGGTVVLEQKYSTGDRDFKAQLTAIKARGVDVIFVPGYYTETGLIIAQARELGIELPILGGDGWAAPEILSLGGKALRNTYYCDSFSGESELKETQQFIAHYKERYGAVPDSTASDAYDSVLMVADAISRAGSTEPAKIRDALATIRDLPGVGGPMTVDAHRDQLKPAYMMGFRDGEYHLVTTIKP